MREVLRLGVFAFVAMWMAGEASAMTPREIYKARAPGVVLVFGTDGAAQGSAGTGSIITSDGQILTNAHVVAKKGRAFKRIFVYLKPDKLVGSMRDDLTQRHEALLVDIDHDLDLALLKLRSPPADLTVIELADPTNVEIGDPVVAIGHPETAGLWTLTTGVVSSVVKDFHGVKGKDVFQTEASINRGNSGGPLLDASGHLIGVNTSISRRASDGLAITDVNFSLKSSVPKKWLGREDLLDVAYVAPAAPSAISGSAPVGTRHPPPPVAEARTPSSGVRPGAAPGAYVVEAPTSEGKIQITVHEPEPGETVAEDPEWLPRAERTATVATAKRAVPGPKILTKRRPYKMDPFVEARVREIRALEDLMRDARKRIPRARKNKGFDSMGL